MMFTCFYKSIVLVVYYLIAGGGRNVGNILFISTVEVFLIYRLKIKS